MVKTGAMAFRSNEDDTEKAKSSNPAYINRAINSNEVFKKFLESQKSKTEHYKA